MAAKQLTLLEALGGHFKKLKLAGALEDSSNSESPSDIEVIELDNDTLASLNETDEQCDWCRSVTIMTSSSFDHCNVAQPA